MKIGHKILFTNGRGNYHPLHYMFGDENDHGPQNSRAIRHVRKGLWSKIRQHAKLNIAKELNYEG